jgi:hypothetical protein
VEESSPLRPAAAELRLIPQRREAVAQELTVYTDGVVVIKAWIVQRLVKALSPLGC